jgi:molybdopterin molybdotransferase
MGGDVAAGDVVLERGTLIGAGQVALLAALGVATPLVYRRPRVGIMASGDEVTTLDHPEAITSGERLADANTPMLTALVTAAGGIPVPLGLVRDHPDAMIAAIRSADDVDLLLSAGAVSVGPRDHVPAVMAALGAELRFRRAMLRPGGPTTVAILPDGRPWLALPGNPVSAFVTFHLFAKPAIRAMMGDPTPVPAPGVARLAEPIDRHPSLDLYLRVALTPDAAGGPPVAQLTGNQGSWVITSIARADGLVVVEAGEGRVAAGTRTPLLVVNGGG